MKIKFSKYHGAGNDFVMIDIRNQAVPLDSPTLFAHVCDRRFGIGADGVILLEEREQLYMHYYNANGRPGSLCGNGGRCFSAFAKSHGLVDSELTFEAFDGLHRAKWLGQNQWSLEMHDVTSIEKKENDYVLDTGSPHYVRFVSDLDLIDPYEEGKTIRNSDDFVEAGINVNFAQIKNEQKQNVVTYERGVEDLTLACGTGVTACAIATAELENRKDGDYRIEHQTTGGLLKVAFTKTGNSYTNIWLSGPAEKSFSGEIDFDLK